LDWLPLPVRRDPEPGIPRRSGGLKPKTTRREVEILGEKGARFVTLRSGGVPETLPAELGGGRDGIEGSIVDATLTGRAATLEDVSAGALIDY
jgi:hypothetical protein